MHDVVLVFLPSVENLRRTFDMHGDFAARFETHTDTLMVPAEITQPAVSANEYSEGGKLRQRRSAQ